MWRSFLAIARGFCGFASMVIAGAITDVSLTSMMRRLASDDILTGSDSRHDYSDAEHAPAPAAQR